MNFLFPLQYVSIAARLVHTLTWDLPRFSLLPLRLLDFYSKNRLDSHLPLTEIRHGSGICSKNISALREGEVIKKSINSTLNCGGLLPDYATNKLQSPSHRPQSPIEK